jgi:hypothetical protein
LWLYIYIYIEREREGVWKYKIDYFWKWPAPWHGEAFPTNFSSPSQKIWWLYKVANWFSII